MAAALMAMDLPESPKEKYQHCSTKDCDVSSSFPYSTDKLSATTASYLSWEFSSVCSAAPSTPDPAAHSPFVTVMITQLSIISI